MKNTIAYTLIMILGIFLTFNAAMAAERLKVIELAESGEFIEFPMTAEEIAAEDAELARRAAVRNARAKAPQERVERIELAESGDVFEFPMSAAEIASEDAKNARQAAVRVKRTNLDKKTVVVFELAESGHMIEFAVPAEEIAVPNTEIASSNPDKNEVGLR